MPTDKPDEGAAAPPPSTATSSLLGGVRGNDRAAWERLVDAFYPLAYGWCRRAGLRPEDAADVCQEVFRYVAAGIAGFRRDRPGDTFRGWLRRITERRIIDHRRSRRRQPEAVGGSDALEQLLGVPDGGDADPPDHGSVSGALDPILDSVRGEFEHRTWQAFWRTTVDGQPVAAVAAELGVTGNAVYLARSRVLARLRQILARSPLAEEEGGA
ncbi:MAG: sigma-70 family polymerase sigma factor [Gemmataceae bacterium]|nr:sigma-70 family polymerase sigma factor [Gemmataceae bacterium]